MKQAKAWEEVVNALRLRYLQGNSHIPNHDEFIDEHIVETLHAIRLTASSKDTTTLVGSVPRASEG